MGEYLTLEFRATDVDKSYHQNMVNMVMLRLKLLV